ncbi:WXG100 family type VII secretion target [Actinoplanes sp. HUAS TT8]|uniref:WXG100 family type VII secretion target n=1 Tax=Actinoplanes sp. HUAS TT8 TaxID=3447453 RepID=UPI003F521A76
MADQMSFAEFRVALGELQAAIGSVSSEKSKIEAAMTAIGGAFTTVDGAWDGPASETFAELKTWFDQVSADLSGILGDMVTRLGTAYSNYHEIELENLGNVS